MLWVGAVGGMEADLVTRAGIPFTSISAGGLHGVGIRTFGNLIKMGLGYFQARKLIRQFKPDVLFFTGGYVAAPVGLAGRVLPTMVCLPDIEPGLAIKVLARFADHVVVPAEESRQYFVSNQLISVTGYPVRQNLATIDKTDAAGKFDLDPDTPILMVMGGSLGARSINRALMDGLPQLLESMQVIHLSGDLSWPEVQAMQQQLPAPLAAKYRPYAYMHEDIGAAFSAADLIVSRAGASILGELPMFGLPAILVPYPHAWRYQRINAEYLVSKGAAVMLRDEDLKQNLLARVTELMQNETTRRQMKQAMLAQAKPEAAKIIANILRQMGAVAGEGS